MTAADEQLLIARVRSGDSDAFRLLVERHMKQAYDIAFGFVRDHDAAQDVAQEAFIRAYRSLGSFRGESQFSTWLYRIVTNLALNRVKQDRRAQARSVALPVAALLGVTGVSDLEQEPHFREHLEKALHELTTLQRSVVILRHMEELSTKQVSEILRCSEGTVKTHLFRAMEKLRRRLAHFREEGTS